MITFIKNMLYFIFPVYINCNRLLNSRDYIDILRLSMTIRGLIVTLSVCNRRSMTLAKRIHSFPHAPALEMVDLLVKAGCDRRTTASVSFEVFECFIFCGKF